MGEHSTNVSSVLIACEESLLLGFVKHNIIILHNDNAGLCIAA